MSTNSKLIQFGKAILFFLTLLGIAFMGVPRIMDTPVRDFVQTTAKSFTGMPYLFGYNATESINAIIERVTNSKTGRITREDVPAILTEVIREHRPDFPQPTVQFVTDAAFNLGVNMLPAEISDSRVLNPTLSLILPRALSVLTPARLPPRYPDLASPLFRAQTWYWVAAISTAIGVIALTWGMTRTILSPQDEKRRTRQVNSIILPPFLLMLGYFAYYLVTFRAVPPAVSIFSAPVYAGVTAWISFVFLAALTLVYFVIVQGVYLLPYFAERVSVLAVWRRLLSPLPTDLLGDLFHRLRYGRIIRYFAKLLFQHFAREAS